MVERLRAKRVASGLVFALGGYMSKFGASVISTKPAPWSGSTHCSPDIGRPVAVDWHPVGLGRILSYTVLYANAHPVRAVVIGELVSGARFIANEADAETLAHVVASDPLGATVSVAHAPEGNSFRFA
jgi:hypothetical protein